MNFVVKFSEADQSFAPQFGEVHNISDGGYERGYAAGYEEGNYLHKVTDKTITAVNDEMLEIVTGSLFVDCTQLKTVNAPNVVKIGNNAFQRCTGLETVNMPKVESIGTYAFANSTIKEAIFPNCTGEIGTAAFQDASGLQRAYFPKVVSVGASAFSRSGLTRIEFDSLEQIKPSYAFNGCRALSHLIIRTPTVCSMSGDAFANTVSSLLRIYVPDNLVEQYKTAANWSSFASQIKPISELEGD